MKSQFAEKARYLCVTNLKESVHLRTLKNVLINETESTLLVLFSVWIVLLGIQNVYAKNFCPSWVACRENGSVEENLGPKSFAFYLLLFSVMTLGSCLWLLSCPRFPTILEGLNCIDVSGLSGQLVNVSCSFSYPKCEGW